MAYTLYSAPFSLYSMMVRHTAVLGPGTADAQPAVITLHLVNHKADGHLAPDFLRINPKGQVPVLAGDSLAQPLSESLAISLFLATQNYPAMLPPAHEAVIRRLLTRLHGVYGLSFSYPHPTAAMVERFPSPVEALLRQTGLSPEYRAALEAKLAFHNKTNATAFHPDVVQQARDDLAAVFAEVVALRRASGVLGQPDAWTFGATVGPTVLDSHLLPLLLRCIEVGNAALVPAELQAWAATMAEGPAWQRVLHGRPTRYDPSMGPIENMTDMLVL